MMNTHIILIRDKYIIIIIIIIIIIYKIYIAPYITILSSQVHNIFS